MVVTIAGMFHHSEYASSCTSCNPFGIWYGCALKDRHRDQPFDLFERGGEGRGFKSSGEGGEKGRANVGWKKRLAGQKKLVTSGAAMEQSSERRWWWCGVQTGQVAVARKLIKARVMGSKPVNKLDRVCVCACACACRFGRR